MSPWPTVSTWRLPLVGQNSLLFGFSEKKIQLNVAKNEKQIFNLTVKTTRSPGVAKRQDQRSVIDIIFSFLRCLPVFLPACGRVQAGGWQEASFLSLEFLRFRYLKYYPSIISVLWWCFGRWWTGWHREKIEKDDLPIPVVQKHQHCQLPVMLRIFRVDP